MTTTQRTDPRPLYRDALAWAHQLVSRVRADQLNLPTPCADFDVRQLIGHLVATVRRAKAAAEGADVNAQPRVITDVPDDGWPRALVEMTESMARVWADDGLLDQAFVVPWGTVSGRMAVWGYLNETLVHGWDLAVATGQGGEADPRLAEAALAVVEEFLPAEPRGGAIPFAPVVPSSAGAGPTERLANWSGHARS
ncbi:MAG: TIGR03086 family protein [Kutzneria sp.]|nr:TIGR03086 family protein [Kutzneria sp.]